MLNAFILFRYKGNSKLSSNEKYEIQQDEDKYILTIKNIDAADMAKYRIVAGPFSSTAHLRVNGCRRVMEGAKGKYTFEFVSKIRCAISVYFDLIYRSYLM